MKFCFDFTFCEVYEIDVNYLMHNETFLIRNPKKLFDGDSMSPKFFTENSQKSKYKNADIS